MNHPTNETPAAAKVAGSRPRTASTLARLATGMLLGAGILLGTSAHALSANEAYGQCKAAAKAAHGDDARVSLKKLRKRGGGKTELRLRVVTEAGAFRADCTIEDDQVVAYEPSAKAPAPVAASS